LLFEKTIQRIFASLHTTPEIHILIY